MNNWDIIIYWDIYIKHLKIYISLSTNELNGATSESYIESPLQSMHRKQTAPFSWTGGICEAHKTQAVASPGKNATLHSTLDCFFCPGEVGHFFFNNLQVFQLASCEPSSCPPLHKVTRFFGDKNNTLNTVSSKHAWRSKPAVAGQAK